ncbi:MAG: type I pullulanase [Phaeodactylibacter sp.]|nr:type I pullulanase [Phaeodactylibacter sp.]MCB9274817.1 type I pullulanase [Lewinellaceae bacterium]
MRKAKFFILILTIMAAACQQNPDKASYGSYDDYPVYKGGDLGLSYSPEQSGFRLWAPAAEAVRLHFYDVPLGGQPTRTTEMDRAEQGTWKASFKEDLKGLYYTFQAQYDGEWLDEAPDPYARAVGTNGKRAQVIGLAETNPQGWASTARPPLASPADIVLYELHIRDLSVNPNSGITHKGKFLGLAETGTTSPEGEATGLDHIKGLGVTHIHLLPSFDFMSVDESRPEDNKFNWGYDPQNYNVPEGSYSTNPADGAVRIREFKQMVKALHDNGLRVVMDVVYNHTGATEKSLFNQLVPGYYYRQNADGGFSNASACGNETASERPMVRKFIVESVKYWATEYQVDGFRFDLMGIHDIETMNQVSAALHEIDPSIFVYGEGWTAGDSPLPVDKRALKRHISQINGVAAFSDDIRDAIKGHVFTHDDPGFVSGKPGQEGRIKFGIVAATRHPQLNYDSIQIYDADGPWAGSPLQTITYVSCHDNHTLWDRLTLSRPETSDADKIRMQKLAGAIVLTSQGVPFLHAGVEMLRTKNGVENSFESPDSINQLDWSRKAAHKDVYEYFQGLIALRKAHPAFRMPATELLASHLRFLETPAPNMVAYTLGGNANGDTWKEILVVFNANPTQQEIPLPDGPWKVAANGEKAGPESLATASGRSLTIPGITAIVLYKD